MFEKPGFALSFATLFDPNIPRDVQRALTRSEQREQGVFLSIDVWTALYQIAVKPSGERIEMSISHCCVKSLLGLTETNSFKRQLEMALVTVTPVTAVATACFLMARLAWMSASFIAALPAASVVRSM